MDKCQRILWLAVLAMLMSAISGFFLPLQQEQNEVRLANTPLGDLLRQARDLEEEDVAMNSSDILMVCPEYLSCLTDSVAEMVTRKVGMLDFEGIISELPTDCSEAPACVLSDCMDEYMLRDVQLRNGLFHLACANKAQFEAGAACWKAPFRSEVMACFQRHNPQTYYSPAVKAMMACLTGVPEGIDACSQESATFFVYFMGQVLSLVRQAYAGAQ